MNLSRRTLLGAAATGAAFGGFARAAQAPAETYRDEVAGYGPLLRDPAGVFDLPEGFRYRVLSRAGEPMSDGLLTPGKMDGMGCLPLDGGRVALIRNHELKAADGAIGPLGSGVAAPADRLDRDRAYDVGADGLPLPGGTTTLVYDVAAGRVERQHQSLIGTMVNCAGGTTPWGSWLSCEETVFRRGEGGNADHGWVFEVPADARGLVEAEPLKALGRFRHEAAAVDPRTGVVYLTEDDSQSLFYRFLPEQPGELAQGGRLQALGFRDAPSGGDARNWDGAVAWRQGDRKTVAWIDLEDTSNPDNTLRLRGQAAGGVWFARGEGVFMGRDELFFASTSGGPARLGQILRYRPSRFEGRPEERNEPGEIELFLESGDRSVLEYGDNLAIAPWGHIFVCEDKQVGINHLKAVTPQGRVYTVGRNPAPPSPGRSNTELAGVCFSPDGSTLFVNLYAPGTTLAITGPWASLRA